MKLCLQLKKPTEFLRPKVHGLFHVKERILHIGPQIRDLNPMEVKHVKRETKK